MQNTVCVQNTCKQAQCFTVQRTQLQTQLIALPPIHQRRREHHLVKHRTENSIHKHFSENVLRFYFSSAKALTSNQNQAFLVTTSKRKVFRKSLILESSESHSSHIPGEMLFKVKCGKGWFLTTKKQKTIRFNYFFTSRTIGVVAVGRMQSQS